MQAIFGDELRPLVPQEPGGGDPAAASSSHSLARARSLDAGLFVPSFAVAVRLAPPPAPLPVRLVARFEGGGGGGADGGDGAGPSSRPPEPPGPAGIRVLHEVTVGHLPPLRLALAFPKGYPSRCPPVAALGADWLSHRQLCGLASGARMRRRAARPGEAHEPPNPALTAPPAPPAALGAQAC